MFKNIYKDRVVLVTGHTGFKGSWLSIWLRELGAHVVGFSLDPPGEPNNFTASRLANRMTHVRGDIRDFNQVADAFEQYRPEFVFHLAAQPIVKRSYEEPKLTFDTNLGGTVNVLEAVRTTPSVRVLVCITSDKCYENKEWIWGYREIDPMGGHDPYSASKGCAELAFSAYQRSFGGIGAASVRAGNVFGGGDWGKDRLLPDCVRALGKGQPVGLRSPDSTRPWQHVLEPLSGYLWLGALLKEDPARYSGPWNFGPDDDSNVTAARLVERFIHYWGEGSWRNTSVQNAPHEATFLRLNCDKAHTELRWKPTVTLDEGLRMAADWYKKYYADGLGEDMYYPCARQIQDYAVRAASKSLPWAAEYV
jgi:CDP-glucose 4,6-dehydratase